MFFMHPLKSVSTAVSLILIFVVFVFASMFTLGSTAHASTVIPRSHFALGLPKVVEPALHMAAAPHQAAVKLVTHTAVVQTETIYTVQSGDSLWTIAQAHGTTWQALQSLNGIVNADLIYPDQQLKLGSTTHTTVTSSSSDVDAPPAEPAPSSPAPPSSSVSSSSGGWEAVAQCESNGQWFLPYGTGTSTGGLQITDSTWAAYGGTAYSEHAYQSSEATQILIAERILAGQGPGAWSTITDGCAPVPGS